MNKIKNAILAIIAEIAIFIPSWARPVFERDRDGNIRFAGYKRSKTKKPLLCIEYVEGVKKSKVTKTCSRSKETAYSVTTKGYIPTREIFHSVESKIYACGDRTCKRWTDSEWEDVLKMLEKKMSVTDIAIELGRTEESVRSKINKMAAKARSPRE